MEYTKTMHTKRYKVLHIIYDMSTAGAQTVVMNLLRNMKDDSLFDVSLLIRDRAKKTEYETELTSEGYNVVYSGYEPTGKYGIFRPVINWIRCQKAIYKAIKKVDPDIVHTHIANILPFCVLPIWNAGIKIRVHTLHSDPYALSKGYSLWTKIAIRVFGFFPVCVTSDQQKKAKIKYGFNESVIIHNGLNTQLYEKPSISRDELRDKYFIPKDAFVIGYVGSLYSTKNIGYLINSFNGILRIKTNSRLIIVGDGADREKLEYLSRELGIQEKVIFTGEQKDVVSFYHAMDVFVLPSLFESSSIVTVEAQLCGIRCVISDSVPRDVIISEKVNRLSLNESQDRWINAILGELDFDTPVHNYRDYSIEESVQRTKLLYSELLGRRCRGKDDR